MKNIEKLVSKKLTKNETKVLSFATPTISYFRSLYCSLRPSNSKIDYKIKNEGENKGQFGYYISHSIGALYILMKRLKKITILDLGSGPGLINQIFHILEKYDNKNIRILKDFQYERFKYTGFEIEDELVKIGVCNNNKIVKKNILTIVKKDVENHEIIYFYEPFAHKKLAEQFVKNLEKVLIKDQIIIYHQVGWIESFLRQSDKFKYVCNFMGLQVFHVVK